MQVLESGAIHRSFAAFYSSSVSGTFSACSLVAWLVSTCASASDVLELAGSFYNPRHGTSCIFHKRGRTEL